MALTNVLALDIGEKRIGIARANLIARIPVSLPTILNIDDVSDRIAAIVAAEDIDTVIVGLPRNLSGLETAQSAYVRTFVASKLNMLEVPILFQDETLSSRVAEDRLKGQDYAKGDIDAGAAMVILEDYLETL